MTRNTGRTAMPVWTGLFVLTVIVGCADDPLVFRGEQRPGGQIFIDEGLTRGIRAATRAEALRSWAADLIARRNSGDLHSAGEAAYYSYGTEQVPASEVPGFIEQINTQTPTVTFYYLRSSERMALGPVTDLPPDVAFHVNQDGQADCISISWYLYGIIIGRKGFAPDWKPWYLTQFDDGIYLYFLEK